MKILFLDLDGTIRETKSGEAFINNPYDQQPIKWSQEACKYYHENGWTLVGITNQGGVKWGYKSLEDMVKEQQETLRIFPELSKINACPDDGFEMVTIHKSHYSLINCEDLGITIDNYFRKPNIGMIEYFLKTHEKIIDILNIEMTEYFLKTHNKTIDISRNTNKITEILFVGDREEDQLCGLNAKIPFLWAHEWRILGAYHQGLISEGKAAKELSLDLLAFREKFNPWGVKDGEP